MAIKALVSSTPYIRDVSKKDLPKIALAAAAVAGLAIAILKTEPLWLPLAAGSIGWALGGLVVVAALVAIKKMCMAKKVTAPLAITPTTPLNKVIPSAHSSAISATHEGNLETQVLDFSFASENGIAYVADNQGHNDIHQSRQKRKTELFDPFNQRLEAFLSGKSTYSLDELKTEIWWLSQKALEHCSTTFTLASIVEVQNQKYAVIFSMGDSGLLIYDKNYGLKEQIFINEMFEFNNPDEFNKVKIKMIPVDEGDVIALITDGIFDFANSATIGKHLANSGKNAKTFLQLMKKSIESGEAYEEDRKTNPEVYQQEKHKDKKKMYTLQDRSGHDDISAALLTV